MDGAPSVVVAMVQWSFRNGLRKYRSRNAERKGAERAERNYERPPKVLCAYQLNRAPSTIIRLLLLPAAVKRPKVASSILLSMVAVLKSG